MNPIGVMEAFEKSPKIFKKVHFNFTCTKIKMLSEKNFRMSHKIGVGTVVQKRTRIHPIIKYPVGGAIGIGFIGHMYSQHNSQDRVQFVNLNSLTKLKRFKAKL